MAISEVYSICPATSRIITTYRAESTGWPETATALVAAADHDDLFRCQRRTLRLRNSGFAIGRGDGALAPRDNAFHLVFARGPHDGGANLGDSIRRRILCVGEGSDGPVCRVSYSVVEL